RRSMHSRIAVVSPCIAIKTHFFTSGSACCPTSHATPASLYCGCLVAGPDPVCCQAQTGAPAAGSRLLLHPIGGPVTTLGDGSERSSIGFEHRLSSGKFLPAPHDHVHV